MEFFNPERSLSSLLLALVVIASVNILIPVQPIIAQSLLQPTLSIKEGKNLSGLLNFETLKVQPDLHKIIGQFLTGQKGSPMKTYLADSGRSEFCVLFYHEPLRS